MPTPEEAAAADLGNPTDEAAAQAEEVRKLREELTQIKALVATQSQNQAGAAVAVVQKANIGVKTTIKVPEMLPKMSFQDYKWDVENWVAYASGHIDKKELAWLLLNHMPAVDDKMVKHTVVEKLGMDKIRSDDGVKLVLEEMSNILECEPFTRLVEWLKMWETLSQGQKSYDKYTTQLRKLQKSAEDNFGFKMPQPLLVAKLLLGCASVKGSNIGMITSGVNLNGLNDDLYSTIEKKVKRFIDTSDTFSDVKSSAHSHNVMFTADSSYVAKDMFGQPIYTPEKIQVPSLTQHSNDLTPEEVSEALIAYKKEKAAGVKGRLGPANNGKSKEYETREQRRARLIEEGKCFETGCRNPTEHVFADCPKRKERLERKKREVLASGGKWYDDPKEAARAKKEAASSEAASTAPKRNYAAALQHINPPVADHELLINAGQEDMVFDEDDDEDSFDRCFKTRRILVASSHYEMSEKLHTVHFTESRADELLIDSGCEKNCSGIVAYDKYIATLSPEDRAEVREYVGSAAFKFGGAGIYKSLKEALIPVYIGGQKKRLRLDVVNTDIPILIGLPVLKQLNLTIQYTRDGQDYAFYNGNRFRVIHRGGHHYMKVSQEGSQQSLDPEEADGRGTFSTFIGKVKVFDPDKIKSQLF